MHTGRIPAMHCPVVLYTEITVYNLNWFPLYTFVVLLGVYSSKKVQENVSLLLVLILSILGTQAIHKKPGYRGWYFQTMTTIEFLLNKPFPTKTYAFWRICSRHFVKTLWQKENWTISYFATLFQFYSIIKLSILDTFHILHSGFQSPIL